MLLVAVLLTAVVLGALLPYPVQSLPLGRGEPVRVGLVQGAIHTDFLLPLDPATRRDFAMLELPPNAEWLMVGWGAKEFYTTVGSYRDLSARALWRALTGDSAVMRYQPVGAYNPDLSVTLDSLQYERLRASILRDTDFSRPIGGALLSGDDRYFAAAGRFNLVQTCNQWIARSLHRTNRQFGAWTPTTWSVRLSLAVHGSGSG